MQSKRLRNGSGYDETVSIVNLIGVVKWLVCLTLKQCLAKYLTVLFCGLTPEEDPLFHWHWGYLGCKEQFKADRSSVARHYHTIRKRTVQTTETVGEQMTTQKANVSGSGFANNRGEENIQKLSTPRNWPSFQLFDIINFSASFSKLPSAQ